MYWPVSSPGANLQILLQPAVAALEDTVLDEADASDAVVEGSTAAHRARV